MDNLINFVVKYGYDLKDELTYNSYRTWKRSETRIFDSISITELLNLIEDKNMELVKRFNSDKMQEACDNWTKFHKWLEDYANWEKLETHNLNINFKTACIKYWIKNLIPEKDYSITYKELPLLTWKLDAICKIWKEWFVLDYKTSAGVRNFKSLKYNLQMAWYRYLSWRDKSALLYLNNKNYSFKETDNNNAYDIMFLELLEYANTLFINNKINNLYND